MPPRRRLSRPSLPAQDVGMLRSGLSIAVLLIATLAWPAAPAAAADITIYRCTGPDGAVTLSDDPCPKGQQQETRTMQRPEDPPPRPVLPAAPAAAAPETSRPTPAVPVRHEVVVVHAPPPTYECTTPDGEVYTSDSPAGNPRWVPMWTLGYPVYHGPYRPRPGLPPVRPAVSAGDNGLVFDNVGRPTPRPPTGDGLRPAAPVGSNAPYGVGTWIRDQCHPIPPAEVCERLRDRSRELWRGYNSALQSEREAIITERRAIQARLDMECPE